MQPMTGVRVSIARRGNHSLHTPCMCRVGRGRHRNSRTILHNPGLNYKKKREQKAYEMYAALCFVHLARGRCLPCQILCRSFPFPLACCSFPTLSIPPVPHLPAAASVLLPRNEEVPSHAPWRTSQTSFLRMPTRGRWRPPLLAPRSG
jgi:hypothetical protein